MMALSETYLSWQFTEPFTKLKLISLVLSCPSNQAKKTKITHDDKQQQT